jgi:transcriptional regulator with XRE-family HTH domain
MQAKYMRFGDFIRKRRRGKDGGLSMQAVAEHLGISLAYISAVESCNKKPPSGEILERLPDLLGLSEDDTALMYDLAARENHQIPYDLDDIFLYEPVGALARRALRLTKTGTIKEEDWHNFVDGFSASVHMLT